MPASILRLEQKYIDLAGSVTYFLPENGGQLTGVVDPSVVLQLAGITPPACMIVCDGERSTSKNTALGGNVKETEMVWSFFIGAASFGPTGEGRLGDCGIYQMIDDVLAAVDGQLLAIGPDARAFFVDFRRYETFSNAVWYQMRFRNQFVR